METKRRTVLDRELSVREKEILLMIRPTTFRDIVDAVRREVDNDRYNARRQLRNLKNGNSGVNGHDENNWGGENSRDFRNGNGDRNNE